MAAGGIELPDAGGDDVALAGAGAGAIFALESANLEVAKVGKNYELLNCDDHASYLRRHGKDPAAYRPDICHQARAVTRRLCRLATAQHPHPAAPPPPPRARRTSPGAADHPGQPAEQGGARAGHLRPHQQERAHTRQPAGPRAREGLGGWLRGVGRVAASPGAAVLVQRCRRDCPPQQQQQQQQSKRPTVAPYHAVCRSACRAHFGAFVG